MNQSEIDEMLKRIVYGGQQPTARSDEGFDLADIQAMGAGFTESGGDDLPKGTKVAFAEQDMDVAGPVSRMPLRPKPAELTQVEQPRTVDVSKQPPGDIEAAYARAQDRRARQSMARERGGRELVAGLTRTQAQPVIQQPVDAFDRFVQSRKEREGVAQRNEQNRLGGARLNFDNKEAARKAAIDEQRRKEDLEGRAKDDERADKGQALTADGIAATRENTKVMQGIAVGSYGIKKDEAARKKTEDDEKRSASAIPLMGGTLNLTPGLSDTDRTRAREVAGLWNASDAAVENFQKTLEDFARNPSNETKGRVTAALRTASSAFNSAIGGGAMSGDEAKAMSDAMGADMISPTGIQALTQSIFGDDGKAAAIISSRVRAARQANRVTALGRLKTSGTFTEGGPAMAQSGRAGGPQRKTATLADGSKVQLSADGRSWEPVQ